MVRILEAHNGLTGLNFTSNNLNNTEKVKIYKGN